MPKEKYPETAGSLAGTEPQLSEAEQTLLDAVVDELEVKLEGTEPEPRSRLKELLAKATPTPWNVIESQNSNLIHIETDMENPAGGGIQIATVNKGNREQRMANASLIMEAVNSVAGLEAEITAQRTALTLNAEECNEWAGKVLGLEAEIAALREQLAAKDTQFDVLRDEVIKLRRATEAARENALEEAAKLFEDNPYHPAWASKWTASAIRTLLKTSASSGTK